MNDFERGFVVAFIHAEGSFTKSRKWARNSPQIRFYNTDLSVMKYLQEILNRELADLGKKPMQLSLKKDRKYKRKKPLYVLQMSGLRIKRLFELCPEFRNFERTKLWVDKVEEWIEEV
ncbi:hypothetical protein DRO59_07120 [Candidatus Bathyarchaeota archaeon]|nr:MAG: hypothetical protein DRO59_07120 [Candidatus Bathyarchaeota archaeon]